MNLSLQLIRSDFISNKLGQERILHQTPIKALIAVRDSCEGISLRGLETIPFPHY